MSSLLRGSNGRGLRGQSPNRSRGASRGRGSTSRGASNSSGISPNENSENSFELDRQANAAKREQIKGTNGTTINGRGGRGTQRGTFNNKQVRFADPLAADQKEDRPSKSPSPVPPNPFATMGTSSPFRAHTTTPFNPFAAAKSEAPNNPFHTPSPSSNLFGAPSQPLQPLPTTIVFGRPSGSPVGTSTPESSQKPTTNPFSAASSSFTTTPQTNGLITNPSTSKPSSASPPTNPFGTTSSPFGTAPQTNGIFSSGSTAKTSLSPPTTNPFGAPFASKASTFSTIPVTSPALSFASPAAISKPSSSPPTNSPFAATSSSQLPVVFATPLGAQSSTFGLPSSSATTSNSTSFGAKPTISAFSSTPNPADQQKFVPSSASTAASASSSALAVKMDHHLRKEGIVPPSWPTLTPGDPKQKGAVEAFWQTSKGYRSKVRASLIRAGFLDDPDKPKKLSEAIDFKGTCEEMCPEFEKITRIVEHDVQGAEKEPAPDGTLWPAPHKMVKALARSAAGQDAPLPMDVRSPAALRRTLDYLLHTVLGEDGDLPTVHGFLWDRTRAIRRDFVFQSSMSPNEQADQIYCLERITRFHVIALHQMSREEVVAEDFSEQQEVEQLGKALLSLIHAYEDCQAQGITCENEAEFRAYYILFNSRNSGILETVQDWGWKFWGESDEIRTAVSLVETLQNIWDERGPLKPESAADIAQNGYSRFFKIVGDRKVSYTMACFAEIHFNSVRKAALKTILTSYRKQRDQTKDWTLTKLNTYLRFDEEEDIIEFGEAYRLKFEESDGDTYLSFDSEDVSDPFPPLKQRHSYALVERKRGDYSLPVVIDATVYDKSEASEEASDEEPLFVKDITAKVKASKAPAFPSPTFAVHNDAEDTAVQNSASTIQSQPTPDQGTGQQPMSIFNQVAAPKTSGTNFASKPVEPSPSAQPKVSQDVSPLLSKTPAQEESSIFSPTSQPQTKPTPPFSFLNQPSSQPSNESTKSSLSLVQHIVTPSPQPTESPKPFFSGQTPVTATPPAQSSKPLFSLGPHPVTASSPPTQSPEPQFSFDGHAVTQPIQASVENTPESPNPTPFLNQAKQSSLPQPNFGTGPTSNSMQNTTFGGTLQVPAQQWKPFPAQSQDKSTGGISSFALTKPVVPDNQKLALDNLAQWVVSGNGGILDQFVEFQVEQLARNAVGIFLKEKADRIAQKEDDLAREQAEQFRYRSLATKYGQRWREAAHRIWLRRKGREARKARQEMAESLRASKVLQSANIVEDFRASVGHGRRGSLESLLDATGVLNGVHDPNNEIRAIIQREDLKPPTKHRSRSDRSTESPATSTNGHKRGKSDNPLRRSILSDPSYLHGGSRIHLMSKYDFKDETRRQVSGVQTDYFRLKARGITTLPNGTPLASSAAKDILHTKHSFDGVTKTTPPRSLMPAPAARSVPTKSVAHLEGPRNGAKITEDIHAMKARAQALMIEDRESHQKKRTFDDEEDELFARAKRVREQMDEGAKWYAKEIERDTKSRSVS